MNDIAVRVGQVWRDNLNDRLLTVVAITGPDRLGDRCVTVRAQSGHADTYSGAYFGQTGKQGFTLVVTGSAITDRRIVT